MADLEYIVLQDRSSGRWHSAVRIDGGEPRLNDACNVIGERDYHAELPDGLEDRDLCDRCFGKGGGE